GTSCCDIAVERKDEIEEKLVAGICGQVDGSVIPGMIGLEAGQSAYGDVYAWFRDLLSWPVENLLSGILNKKEVNKAVDLIIPGLTEEAYRINPGESSLIALDWLNGRRTPYADQKLKGAILGVTLGTDAPKLFRVLVEATSFGAKAIVERFSQENIIINQVVAIGGIPKKSLLVMQILSDVLNMPVKVARSEQAVALGAAMFGAVVAGIYKSVEEAQKYMGSGFEATYYPDKENVLKKYAAEENLSGFAIQCWTAMQEEIGVSPCLSMGRLTDSGIMCACEVDIYGAITMAVQHLLTFKQDVPHFIDWTIQNQENENMLLAWHCGNAPISLKCKSCMPQINTHSVLGWQIGYDKSYGTAEFQL
ncbi:unnamed protein product, partial [marine sediment metagenome]